MNKKVYVIVTIDTECDKDSNWEIPQPMSFLNIEIQKTLLMPIFNKYKIIPTYLLSPEVLLDESSVKLLKTINEASFGTHLHEEFLDPNAKKNVNRTSNIQANLSYDIEYKKIKNLTDLFYEKFNFYPKSFRSGRFGSSSYTCQILEELGYIVDSSVTPYKTLYFQNNIKINKWHVGIEPYFEKSNKNEKGILQVPLTLINRDFEKLPKFILKHLETKQTYLKRIFRKLGYISKTEWLRPYRTNGDGLINIANHVILNHFKTTDFAILNIMFHSNELLEKGSPYCQTKEEVKFFLDSLDELFNYISNNYDLCSTALEDVLDLYYQK